MMTSSQKIALRPYLGLEAQIIVISNAQTLLRNASPQKRDDLDIDVDDFEEGDDF